MIFRPKTDVVDPSFFPFFISSDYFMEEAIRISVGSLSPTVNWGTLKNLEFNLPDDPVQQLNARLLSAFERTKETYKNLMTATNDLMKSQEPAN
jgi:type I restriction enzyme S subunit